MVIWTDIIGPDPNDARFLPVRHREDGAEVQIVREHDKIIRDGMAHDLLVGGIWRTDHRPMYRFESRLRQPCQPTR